MGLETALAIGAIAATATGTVMSYQSQRQAARQTELNAEAQAAAIAAENKRKAAEQAENVRRLAMQSRRERADQLADIAGSGFVTSTGTPLAIMADTIEQQSRRLSDVTYQSELERSQLAGTGQSILQEGRSSSRAIRAGATGGLITGLAGATVQGVNAYGNRAQTAPTAYDYRTRRPVSGSLNI